MSVFEPMTFPDSEVQKQNVVAQLMQQHYAAANRFSGRPSPLTSPMRGIAPPVLMPFGLSGVKAPVQPGAYPSAVGPTIARRSHSV